MESITVCTMIIHGLEDLLLPLANHALPAHAAIPGSQLVVFALSGHHPFLEQKQLFHDELAQFAQTCTAFAPPLGQGSLTTLPALPVIPLGLQQVLDFIPVVGPVLGAILP